VLNNSGHPTAKEKITVASAGLPWLRKNAGDGRTPTLATGVYNERLVKRSEYYLSPDFIGQWDELLSQIKDCLS
jgi:hypothetical protein